MNVKVWSGIGHCAGCTVSVALTFEAPEKSYDFPKAVFCPVCCGSIRLVASYVIKEAESKEGADA